MHVYMKVTNDELELPEAIGETARELAGQIGVSIDTIYAAISRGTKRYVKVEVDDDELPELRERKLAGGGYPDGRRRQTQKEGMWKLWRAVDNVGSAAGDHDGDAEAD